MSTKLDLSETVSIEEALKMEMIVNQALVDILIAKGIFTQEELMSIDP